MQKKDLFAEFKKITKSKGADPLKQEPTPYRDWRILVSIFFVGLVVSMAFNIYMSVEINRDSFFTVASKSTGVAKFNEDALVKLITRLDEKALLFEKAKKEGVSAVDPSI